MTRGRTPKVVLTFATTSDALAVEAAAREHGLPGRAIPVPSEISAGCGLAWCADERDREELLAAIGRHGLDHEGAFTVNLY